MRHHHYEAALAEFLHTRGIAWVGTNEARRALVGGLRIKSFDLVIYCPHGPNWIVDVKGRCFTPARRTRGRLENWVTCDDLDALAGWERAFGNDFRALLVFAYRLPDGASHPLARCAHAWHGQRYAFVGIPAADYRLHAHRRSLRWDTVHMPARTFERLARPLIEWCVDGAGGRCVTASLG